MIAKNQIEAYMQPLQSAFSAHSRRQQLLSSNIANANTPQYKARDLDFKAAMDSVFSGEAAAGGGMWLTNERHLSGDAGGAWDQFTKYRAEYQGAVDGNTVNMDMERADFAENGLRMEALIMLVRKRIEGLQTAMRER